MKKNYFLWILGSFAITFCACSSSTSNPETGNESLAARSSDSTYTRVNANTSPLANKVLALYAYGQQLIQNLDCENPAAWFYQGAMHNVPHLNEIGSGIDTLCASYATQDSTARRGWRSCPHMKPTNMQLNFLTWHRLYTYYYERNIRTLLKKNGISTEEANQFSLPYWDYTNEQGMPEPFRLENFNYVLNEAQIIGNPLYFASRAPSLMQGMPIDTTATDSIAINLGGSNVKNLCLRTMAQALNYNKFLAMADVSEFSRGMEDRLHNVMHDYIGGAVEADDKGSEIYNPIYQKEETGGFGMMAYVPSAGFDPIFFLHHANVDRMFYAWEAAYGEITPEQMQQYGGDWSVFKDTYQFWDEETQQWITYETQADMLADAHSVQYTYEELPIIKTAKPKATQLAGSAQRRILHKATHMEDQKAKVAGIENADRLDEDTAESKIVWVNKAQNKLTDTANKRYILEADLTFGQNILQQLVVFTIPEGEDWDACDLDPDYIFGVNAFFGSTHGMEHGTGSSRGHNSMSRPMDKMFTHTVQFDVTQAVRKMKPDSPDFKVYFGVLNGKNGGDFYLTETRLFEEIR